MKAQTCLLVVSVDGTYTHTDTHTPGTWALGLGWAVCWEPLQLWSPEAPQCLYVLKNEETSFHVCSGTVWVKLTLVKVLTQI